MKKVSYDMLTRLECTLSAATPTLMDARGRYAVLVPLVERGGELHLLYEVRAANMRRQPGEVCFPGGRIERDETPEECALRETEEELGIPRARIHVIGSLDFIAHRSNSIIYPVLACVEEEGYLAATPNENEVGEIFLVPLDYLRTHAPLEYQYTLRADTPEDFPYDAIGIPHDYRWQTGSENVPVYHYEGHAIWGLTGRMTRHLLRRMEIEG